MNKQDTISRVSFQKSPLKKTVDCLHFVFIYGAVVDMRNYPTIYLTLWSFSHGLLQNGN